MADENGLDEGSDPIDEEDRVEDTRRVRPLFRFGRRKDVNGGRNGGAGTGEPEPEPEPHERVRPVRVVRFVPEEAPGEEAPFADVDSEDLDAAFGGDGEEPAFVVEGEPAFVEEGGPAFVEEGGPADFVEGEAPFAEVVEDEAPFAEVVDEEPASLEEEAPFAFEEEETPFVMEEGERAFVEAVPEVPFAEIEEAERVEAIQGSVSPQEEAETAEEFEFRSEETPESIQSEEPAGPGGLSTTGVEAKPHYHKYLRPDEELLQQKQARGRPTGFDRDVDADAGEIDFGIDLIDPSERRKRKAPKGASEAKLKKSTTGGHDSDGEVGTRELGVDIGVDYQKRRKRRL